MSTSSNSFAAAMKTLYPPTLLNGKGSETRLRVNSHIHLPPNFSAFETTAQAMELAREQDIRVLGVSNYYDYSVYDDFARRAETLGIFPLFGLEIITLIDDLVREGIKINDPGNPGKMYICGKGITRWEPMSDTAGTLLQVIRDNDSERMTAVVEKLSSVFAARDVPIALDSAAIKARIVVRHGSPPETVYLQERHVAQAFQEVLFDAIPQGERMDALERVFGTMPKARPDDAVGVQNEIRSQLIKAGKPAFVPETFVDFVHAHELILALGGIPCYPTLADGVAPICLFEEPVDKLVANLEERRVYCAEFIPIRNTPEVLGHYVHSMRRAGLFVTAGTEHNTLDLLPLEPTCLDGAPIPGDLKDIFWEGACVVAAHQYLKLNGQMGFVEEDGRPNQDYASDDERIRAFHRLGASVIGEYRRKCGK